MTILAGDRVKVEYEAIVADRKCGVMGELVCFQGHEMVRVGSQLNYTFVVPASACTLIKPEFEWREERDGHGNRYWIINSADPHRWYEAKVYLGVWDEALSLRACVGTAFMTFKPGEPNAARGWCETKLRERKQTQS